MFRWALSKTHVSWVITAVALGFVGGVATAQWGADYNLPLLLLLTGGLTCSVIAMTSRWRLLVPLAILGGLLLGWWRAVPALTDFKSYLKYVGDDVTITGQAMDDPSETKAGTAVNLNHITMTVAGRAVVVTGKMWLSLANARPTDLKRADRITVAGSLDDGFGAYVAALSRAQLTRVERTPGADPLGDMRNDFSQRLSTVLSPTEAGLGMGLIAGQKSAMGEDIQDAFVAASLTHILVASGANLTILVRFARRLFVKKSRLIALIFSVTLVLLFAGVTGASASMNRAVIVSILSLLLWYVGRKIHPIVLLSTVAAVTIAVDPTQLWGDTGWFLSFGSFAGVIVLAPLINDLWQKKTNAETADTAKYDQADVDNATQPKHDGQGNADGEAIDEADLTQVARIARRVGTILGSVGQVMVETLSAQVWTWPIIAVVMGNVSLVGLLTNILVLPLIPLAMLLTFLTGLMTYVLPVAATALAIPTKWLLDWIIGVAQWGESLPGADMEFQPTMAVVAVYYIGLIGLMLLLKNITKHNFYGDNVVE